MQQQSRYENFLWSVERLSGNSQVTIVEPDKYDQMVLAVLEDGSLGSEFKVFVLFALSTGCRVSELLSIRKKDLSQEGGNLFARVKVLKRRKAESKTVRIHPAAVDLVLTYVKNKVGTHLFDSHASTMLRRVKRAFGGSSCNHGFRYSFIGYLMNKNLSPAVSAKLMKMSSDVMTEVYFKIDAKKVLSKIF